MAALTFDVRYFGIISTDAVPHSSVFYCFTTVVALRHMGDKFHFSRVRSFYSGF
jgi:hypothetical protein